MRNAETEIRHSQLNDKVMLNDQKGRVDPDEWLIVRCSWLFESNETHGGEGNGSPVVHPFINLAIYDEIILTTWN